MNAIVKPDPVRSIVPAFFVIEAEAEEADALASIMASKFNQESQERLPRGVLYLCESSPTTEWDSPEDPHTLEGLTCDSGSDRSAAGLIRTIADYSATEPGRTLSGIKQMAESWLRQRMALRSIDHIDPAEPVEKQDAIDLLFHAFARSEVRGAGALRCEDIEAALRQAMAERPGRYEEVLAFHQFELEAHGRT